MPTKDELLDRARDLAPAFRARAQAAEQARTLPRESVVELLDAGIARILVPARFGGDELGLDTWFELVREIAKADASHGWCASLIVHHAHYIAQFPEAAQQDVWSAGPDVALASSIVPYCEVKPVDGGYRISGRAPFASGVNHASWVLLGGLLHGAGPPDWLWFLLPKAQVEVEDTWFTSAMCATGSNTIVSDDIFVPDTHVIRQTDLLDATAPGSALNSGPLYRWPWVAYAPLTFAAPILGAAQGALADFLAATPARRTPAGQPLAEITAIQVAVGRAAAAIDAAELLLRRIAEAPEPPSLELRARTMRDYAAAVELILPAIDALTSLSGSSAFASSQPIQRAWRDIHFAATHHALGAELNLSHFGRTALGLPRLAGQDSY